jgi:hypothetical protein
LYTERWKVEGYDSAYLKNLKDYVQVLQ